MTDTTLVRTPNTPWYRVGFVWLLFMLPTIAVLAGFATLALAIYSDDGVVVDDYYRRGKEINRDLARDRVAATLNLRATLTLDGQGGATIDLHGAAPSEVQLLLLHATRQGHDATGVIPRAHDGKYRAPFPSLVQGRYDVQLAAANWRLNGSLWIPRSDHADLMPSPVR
jgi:hypothetical protein